MTFFSDIGNNSDTNAYEPQTSHDLYLSEPLESSTYLKPTSIVVVKTIICHIKVSSPSHDKINIKVIKECSAALSPVLLLIINKSFIDSYFPNLKIARIIPVFKN